MPLPKRSKKKAGRIVRHTLADGTVKEYRYGPHKPKPLAAVAPDSLRSLIESYRRSPEWAKLAAATRQTYSIYLRELETVGHVSASTIRKRDLLNARDAVAQARGNGAGTGFIRSASALFAWAVEREWIEHSPASRIKALEGGHLRAWTTQEASAAIHGLPEHLRRVVVLALYIGQRRGDLCALRWSSYDGVAIHLTQQKTGAELVIPAHPVLKAELDAWRSNTSTLTILTNLRGRPWKPQLLSHALPTALGRLGLPSDLNVHGLRKLAAANLADVGCSTHEIAAITGHSSLSMVQLYTKTADQQRLAEAAITRLVAGKAAPATYKDFYNTKAVRKNVDRD